MLKRGTRGFRGFQVPTTKACTLLPLVKIGEHLAICHYPAYPHKNKWLNALQ